MAVWSGRQSLTAMILLDWLGYRRGSVQPSYQVGRLASGGEQRCSATELRADDGLRRRV